VIVDADGNVFGGFSPVEWESRDWNGKYGSENNCWKADPSLRSFLFTLTNPHDVPPRKFALRAEWKDHGIVCRSQTGPRFGDIAVSDNSNANTESATCDFGVSYTNDTGLERRTFFTGSDFFQVNEIEVFEITD
jgi:hypothetical protein